MGATRAATAEASFPGPDRGTGELFARCGCGHTDEAVDTAVLIELRQSLRVATTRFAEGKRRSESLCDSATRRTQGLSEQRERLRIRRTQLAARRRLLAEQLEARRADLLTAERRAAAALLEAGRAAAGITMSELWLDYFALGGDRSLAELQAALSADRPLYRIDHDRVAVALNEHFAERGLGRPIAYWDGSR